MPPALRLDSMVGSCVDCEQPTGRSLLRRLVDRELSSQRKHVAVADVPTRNTYLDNIMDTDSELKNVILLGWTIDGNHMVSYRAVVSEFDEYTFSLQLWRLDKRMVKVADLQLFEGHSFSQDHEVFLSVNETADQEFFVVRGEFRNWELTAVEAEIFVLTCIFASPFKGKEFSKSLSHTLPAGYVVAPRQVTQDIMFINSIATGVNLIVANEGNHITFHFIMVGEKDMVSLVKKGFSAETFLASQLDSAPRLKVFSLVDYDLRIVQVVESSAIVLVVAFLRHDQGRSEQNRRGAFLLKVSASPESDLDVRVLQYLEAPWRGR